jgi:hypothetical protein
MDQAQLLALGQDLLLLLSPLVAQGAIQKLGEDTTDRVTLLAQRAWGALQQRFTGSPKAQAALTLYADEPGDPGLQQRIAQQIAACFADHQAAIAEFQAIVRGLRAATGAPVPQQTNTQTISGNARVGVANVGDVHGGSRSGRSISARRLSSPRHALAYLRLAHPQRHCRARRCRPHSAPMARTLPTATRC